MVFSPWHGPLSKVHRWWAIARGVRDRTEKGVCSQVWELIRLHLAAGHLSAFEYYTYGLYDDRHFSPPAKRAFLGGKSAGRLSRRLNHRFWRAIANDKLVLYTLLQGLGLPFPALYAVYHPGGRWCGGVPSLTEPAALAAFLRETIPYKPRHGFLGLCHSR